MKNILKILPVSLLGVFVMNSCGNEDPISEIPKGAMVYFSQGAEDDGFIDILDLSTVVLDFTVSMTDATGRNLEFAPVESIDVTVTYTNQSEGTSEKVILENITSWPKSYQLNPQQLVDLFPDNVVTAESLDLGDNFQISADFHLEDGRFLSGWSPALVDKNPASIYSVLIDYAVACASSIPTGTYTTLTSGQSTDGCCTAAVIDLPGEVTISSPVPGQYMVDDIFAGLYIEWYDVYGLTFKVEQSFTDVCNNLTATFNDPFNGGVTMEGAFDPATGEISFTASNTFGDTWTTLWTPK
jgi:hypothetical protein